MDTITIANIQKYTIEVKDFSIVVRDGRMPSSRLKYHAPGLEIYVKGSIKVARRDIVNYHAFAICAAHHIPIKKLIAEGWA